MAGKDVGRFDVGMDEFLAMQLGKPRQDLHHEPGEGLVAEGTGKGRMCCCGGRGAPAGRKGDWMGGAEGLDGDMEDAVGGTGGRWAEELVVRRRPEAVRHGADVARVGEAAEHPGLGEADGAPMGVEALEGHLLLAAAVEGAVAS